MAPNIFNIGKDKKLEIVPFSKAMKRISMPKNTLDRLPHVTNVFTTGLNL